MNNNTNTSFSLPPPSSSSPSSTSSLLPSAFPQATTMEEYQQQLIEWRKQYDAYMAAQAAYQAQNPYGAYQGQNAYEAAQPQNYQQAPYSESPSSESAEPEPAKPSKKYQKQKKSVNNSISQLNIPGITKSILPKSVKVDEHNSYVLQTGEKKWIDPSLADWPDDDFRLFVGDIGNDCSEELLREAFKGYPSLQKVKVIKKRSSNKSRSYGFLSFSDPKEFLSALREMNGKYVGTRPIRLMRSKWKDRLVYDPKNPPAPSPSPSSSTSKKKTKSK